MAIPYLVHPTPIASARLTSELQTLTTKQLFAAWSLLSTCAVIPDAAARLESVMCARMTPAELDGFHRGRGPLWVQFDENPEAHAVIHAFVGLSAADDEEEVIAA